MTTRKKIVKKPAKSAEKKELSKLNVVGFVILTLVQLITAALVVLAVITAILVPFNNGDILMCATLLALSFMACALVQVCYDL